MNTIVTAQDTLVVLDTTSGDLAVGLRDRFNALTALAVNWQDGNLHEGSWGGQKTVLIYPSLYSMFLQGIQNSTLPSQTLTDWRTLAETLLAQYRKRRSKAFLLESDAILQATDIVQARLAAWAGTESLSESVPPDAAPMIEDASCRLLAAHALMSSRNLRRLSDELAAGGFAMRSPQDEAPEAIDAVFALRSQRDAARAAQEAAAQQADAHKKDAARQAAHGTVAAQQAKARETALAADLAAANTRSAALEQELRTITDRAELVPGLQQKTTALQELLEQEFTAHKAQRAIVKAFQTQEKPHLEHQISELSTALAAEQQTSAAAAAEVQDLVAKLAAHIRRTERLANDEETGFWSQTALVAERDQTLAARAADILALQAEAGILRRLVAARDQLIVDQTVALQNQAETLRLKQIAIDEIKQSTSWKITQPLRVVRSSIGRS